MNDKRTTHTPGPWAVYDGQWGDHSATEGGGFQIIMGPYDGGAIRSINLINYADGQYEFDNGYQEAKANARLIAAAPDLLEALKAIRNASKKNRVDPDAIHEIAAGAIAQAEGTQS